jgi:hypothetical protein
MNSQRETPSAEAARLEARKKVLADLQETMEGFGKQGSGTGLVTNKGFGYDEPPQGAHEPVTNRVRATLIQNSM